MTRGAAGVSHPFAPNRLVRHFSVAADRNVRAPRSIRILAFEEGQEHGLEIQPQAPILQVMQVVADPLHQAGVAAQAVDLGPAGQPGLAREPGVIVRNLVFEISNQLGPFRPIL